MGVGICTSIFVRVKYVGIFLLGHVTCTCGTVLKAMTSNTIVINVTQEVGGPSAMTTALLSSLTLTDTCLPYVLHSGFYVVVPRVQFAGAHVHLHVCVCDHVIYLALL